MIHSTKYYKLYSSRELKQLKYTYTLQIIEMFRLWFICIAMYYKSVQNHNSFRFMSVSFISWQIFVLRPTMWAQNIYC